MLKVWGRNTSSNVQKAMWAIGELGLEHERFDIGGTFGKNREPAYLNMNPNGLVPTGLRGLADRVQAIPRLVAERRSTPCRELWRGTLVVLWDGRVTVCCVDSEGELQVGDARRDRLDDLWNGDAIRSLRRRHRDGAWPALCANCGEYAHPEVSKRFR